MPARRPPARRASSAELLGEERHREQPPGEVDVRDEEERRLAADGQVADAQDERVETARELSAAVAVVEIGGKRLDGAVVDLRRSRCGSPPAATSRTDRRRRRSARLRRIRLPAREIGEHRQRIAKLARVDPCQQLVELASRLVRPRWHHRDMDEVLAKAEEWRAAGEEVALATVVGTRRSAPRPLGSKLAVTSTGRMSAPSPAAASKRTSASARRRCWPGASPELVSYGIADDEAWSVGLPCGGEIDVFVEPFAAAPPLERGTSYVVVAGDGVGERWHDDSQARTTLHEEAGRTVFAERVAPPPRLVAVGAGDIAEALCAIAKPLGWQTVVVDPAPGSRPENACRARTR